MANHVLGTRGPRVDALEKVTGAATYTADMPSEGALIGKVLRSSIAHARVLQVDTEKARRLPGVKAVFTARDTTGRKFGLLIEDEVLLATDRVRHIGEEIAAVVAVDEETVEEALGLIRVDYDELPAVFDATEAMSEGAPLLHDVPNNIAVHHDIGRGQIEEALGRADFLFEDAYETQIVHQGYLEPTSCVAEASRGRVSVWAPFQSVFYARELIGKALGLTPSRVRCVQATVGGAFGGKLDSKIFPLTAFMSYKTGRRVRMAYSRYEEFAAGRPRVPMKITLRTGVMRDGKIVGRHTKVVANNGAYTSLAKMIPVGAAIRNDCIYRIQHTRNEVFLVYTNCLATGQFRGYGNPQGMYAAESQLDAIAERIGIDPLEFRLINGVEAGDTTAHGWELGTCGLKECIRRAGAAAGWQEKRKRPRQNGPIRRGIGIACTTHNSGAKVFGDYDTASVLVKLNEDGRVTLMTAETDLGQGAYTALAVIVAEELGIELEDIEVAGIDTDLSPYGLGAFASRITTVGGHAAKMAAADAKRQLLETAAKAWKTHPEDLMIAGGVISTGKPGAPRLTLAEAAKLRLHTPGGIPVLGVGVFGADTVSPDPKTKYGNYSLAYSFAAQIAEVEVDIETGRTRVLRVYAAHDLGKAIYPPGAEGQVEGGILQGIGFALYERYVVERGQVINPHLGDYTLPSFRDAPRVETIFVETEDPHGPYGAKGVAETAIEPTAGAVANAVAHATGVRFNSIPLTAEKIFFGIQGSQKAGR